MSDSRNLKDFLKILCGTIAFGLTEPIAASATFFFFPVTIAYLALAVAIDGQQWVYRGLLWPRHFVSSAYDGRDVHGDENVKEKCPGREGAFFLRKSNNPIS